MKRVLVLITNRAQASFRLRIEALVPLLAGQGFELDIRLIPRGWKAAGGWIKVFRAARRSHAVILQRKLLDPWNAMLLSRVSRRLFYDVDDAVMFHNRQVGLISRWRTRVRFQSTARVLDRVVAGNEYLADIFRQQGCIASVVPTVLDCTQYQVKVHEPTDTPRLVWIGSNSTLGYVEAFLPAFERAAREIPGLCLLTIADHSVISPFLKVEYEPWSKETEALALCRGDIGIAPTPIDPWTLGKCGFKVLQYMAAGLPVIASPVGANSHIVQDGVTGFLPRDERDWPAAIIKLARDAELRSRMGRAGRELSEKHYSLSRAADEWAKVLKD